MAAAQMHSEGRLVVAENSSFPSAKSMSDDTYDSTWAKSIARKGRTDEQMRALEPDLEPYQLDDKSDMISYHRRPAKKTGDLIS